MTSIADPEGSRRGRNWISWLLGIALVFAVAIAAFHFSEQRQFVRIVQTAEPWWVALALLLQAATYMAQGGIWRCVALTCGYRVPREKAFELGLARLFTDQALPSAGLSSSIMILKALERRGVPAPTAKASVLIDLASYHLAYAATLAVAMAIVIGQGHANTLIVVAALLFLVFAVGLSLVILTMAGRRLDRPAALRKHGAIRKVREFMQEADGPLVRNPRVLARTLVLQTSIFLLDTSTDWVLIRALGARASVAGVFASLMISSLFRTVGIVPGGLGTFEATSVLTLRMAGVDLAVALSATLLFRGLSFWLPMLPGYWCSRRALTVARVPAQQRTPVGSSSTARNLRIPHSAARDVKRGHVTSFRPGPPRRRRPIPGQARVSQAPGSKGTGRADKALILRCGRLTAARGHAARPHENRGKGAES